MVKPRCQVSGVRYQAIALLLCAFCLLPTALGQEPITPTRGVFSEVQVITNALPPVSVVNAYTVGQAGGQIYYYWIVAKYGMNRPAQDQPAGNATPSNSQLISNAPFTLNGSNYVRVCWNLMPDATGYDVLRTTTSGLPNGAANIGVALNTAGNCVSDQGAALQAYTISTYNPAKTVTSLKYAKLDMPRITPPLDNPPAGQCRLFVNNSTNSFDAIDATGASCFPSAVPPGTLTCDPSTIVDIYVATTGSDVTGTGAIGSPYATIQHAIDTDVPVFVGAKYYIHLAAGTYPGTVNYIGHTDCGGGLACGSIPPDTPFSTGLAIIGSETGVASDSYAITGAMIVDGLKLYLQGVRVSSGSIGLKAQNGAQVAVAAVNFQNNNLGLLAATWSQVYLVPGVYVQDDYATALATANNFSASSDGFEATEDSVITDTCPDGDNAPLGTTLACITLGTGRFGIACAEAKKAQYYMRDDVLVDFSLGGNPVNGIQALDSHYAMADYTYTGHGAGGTGIKILSGRMSGAAFGGGVYNINTAATGVIFGEGGEITEPVGFVSVTKNYSSTFDSTKAGTNFVGYGGTVYVNAFSGTPTFNLLNGTTQKITLTGNVTASTITNGSEGMILTMQICQDAGGGHTFAWDANALGAGVIGGTGSTCSVQRFMYDGTAAKWYAIGTIQTNM